MVLFVSVLFVSLFSTVLLLSLFTTLVVFISLLVTLVSVFTTFVLFVSTVLLSSASNPFTPITKEVNTTNFIFNIFFLLDLILNI